jgi:hypothetical protein
MGVCPHTRTVSAQKDVAFGGGGNGSDSDSDGRYSPNSTKQERKESARKVEKEKRGYTEH